MCYVGESHVGHPNLSTKYLFGACHVPSCSYLWGDSHKPDGLAACPPAGSVCAPRLVALATVTGTGVSTYLPEAHILLEQGWTQGTQRRQNTLQSQSKSATHQCQDDVRVLRTPNPVPILAWLLT